MVALGLNWSSNPRWENATLVKGVRQIGICLTVLWLMVWLLRSSQKIRTTQITLMAFNIGPRIILGNHIKLCQLLVDFFSGIIFTRELICYTITTEHIATNTIILAPLQSMHVQCAWLAWAFWHLVQDCSSACGFNGVVKNEGDKIADIDQHFRAKFFSGSYIFQW